MTRGPSAREVFNETRNTVHNLVGLGLADDSRDPVLTVRNGRSTIQTQVRVDGSVLHADSYAALYEDQFLRGVYNALLPDGALLQMCYEFAGRTLASHRLAYLPSPDLEPFQNDPEMYIREVPYLDVVGRQVVPVPLRFDYDARPGVAQDGAHPVSHLTLGQYAHCRIALTGPVRPSVFADFVVRHFYSAPGYSLARLASAERGFSPTITTAEALDTHLSIML
ncbi:DUF2290 domain-containing protein [Arthrobacter sp. efr-133-TYG-120]|uniref:DUF2290 domain-containing protein n=1 Tax=Arthrobacter sp. efr-133-TYG-120 TaxID=3040280 RepID=UPI003305F20F